MARALQRGGSRKESTEAGLSQGGTGPPPLLKLIKGSGLPKIFKIKTRQRLSKDSSTGGEVACRGLLNPRSFGASCFSLNAITLHSSLSHDKSRCGISFADQLPLSMYGTSYPSLISQKKTNVTVGPARARSSSRR